MRVYVDGVKENALPETKARNEEVKRIVHEKQWCGNVEVVEQPSNKGLARSIRDGVTDMLERFGRVIVVEDDKLATAADDPLVIVVVDEQRADVDAAQAAA